MHAKVYKAKPLSASKRTKLRIESKTKSHDTVDNEIKHKQLDKFGDCSRPVI